MKRFFKYLVLLLVLIPTVIKADFTVVADDEIDDAQTVDGSAVLAGDNVISTGVVDGVDMLFGNEVKFRGVGEYLVAAGNSVILSGNIKKDGVVFANTVNCDKSFTASRDLAIFADTVSLNGVIERDIVVFANRVNLENVEIKGNIRFYGNKVNISSDAKVSGKLYYDSLADVKDNNSNIAMEQFVVNARHISNDYKAYSVVITYGIVMSIFLGLGLIVPSLFKRISEKFSEAKIFDLISTLGFGALALIGVPIVSILLCMTLFGIGLGLLLLGLYVITLILSIVLVGYLVGHFICTRIIKQQMHHLLVGLIGISVLYLLTLIPILNTYIVLITIMLSLGIVIRLFRKN